MAKVEKEKTPKEVAIENATAYAKTVAKNYGVDSGKHKDAVLYVEQLKEM
jgi:hypothetical protein